MRKKQNAVALPAAHIATKMAQWRRVRDCVGGADDVRAAGTLHLPKLSDMTSGEYKSYALRPAFFEATARTRAAMTGVAFAKPVNVELPSALDPFALDIDAAGTTLNEFATHLVDEMQTTGFGFLYVQHTGTADAAESLAAVSGRPILEFYPAEAVLDYKMGVVNGVRQLTLVRLAENIEVETDDEFAPEFVEQIRVLDLFKGTFRERLFRETENAKKEKVWVAVATATPLMNGAPIPYIPGRVVTADGKQTIGNAPLAALAELNLSHWRTSADYEHALHFCGLPTPYVTGVTETAVPRGDVLGAIDGDEYRPGFETMRRATQSPTIKLGSSQILTFENPQAKVGFLSLDPSGVTALNDALDRKERQMSVLGARMLSQDKAGVESAQALDIKRSGETAALSRLCASVSAALTDVLTIVRDWLGATGDVLFAINTDYATHALSAQEITALLSAVNAGQISRETFIFNLQRGGRMEPGVTVDDEIERIEITQPEPQPIDDMPTPDNDVEEQAA